MKIKAFRARFKGLYEWGVGWISKEKMEAWRKYFESMKNCFWSYHTRGDSQYLVTTGGSIYLHPMDVTLVCQGYGGVYVFKNGVKVEEHPEIDSLKEILTGVAEACGGSVEFSSVHVYEIEAPEYGG